MTDFEIIEKKYPFIRGTETFQITGRVNGKSNFFIQISANSENLLDELQDALLHAALHGESVELIRYGSQNDKKESQCGMGNL